MVRPDLVGPAGRSVPSGPDLRSGLSRLVVLTAPGPPAAQIGHSDLSVQIVPAVLLVLALALSLGSCCTRQ